MQIHSKIRDYEVIVENNLLHQLQKYVSPQRKIMLVSDDGVPSTYLSSVKKQFPNIHIFIFPHGEENKNLSTYLKLIEELVNQSFTRQDLLIALGGGVVGDLTLFAGATYLRGIEVMMIPTTTMAMCDSSIGGKCGIDYGTIKNYLGSFYPPSKVLMDPYVLKTLPKRHLHNGLVEALKMGMIYDPELFQLFLNENIEDHLIEIIKRSLDAKKYFVEQDEKESFTRMALNFGHTVGHALESQSGFQLLHGEAVASGMLAMCRTKEVKEQLQHALQNLKITMVDYHIDDLVSWILKDKKRHGDAISLVFVIEIGKYQIKNVKLNEIYRVLEGENDAK